MMAATESACTFRGSSGGLAMREWNCLSAASLSGPSSVPDPANVDVVFPCRCVPPWFRRSGHGCTPLVDYENGFGVLLENSVIDDYTTTEKPCKAPVAQSDRARDF